MHHVKFEILIKKDRPMRVARSARRRRQSHCNIMAARGEAVIGEERSDECAGARRSDEWKGSGGRIL